VPDRWVRLFPVRRGMAPPDPTDIVSQDERWNARQMAFVAPFDMAALGAIPSFFALYAIQLGASNVMVGWLTGGPALISLLWLLPCGRIIQNCRRYLYPLVIGAGVHRLFLISLAFVPFLPAEWRAGAVVAVAALSALPGTTWGMSHQTVCGEMFTARHMARLLSRRWAVMNASNVLLTLLLGRMLDVVRFPLNFQLLFAGVGGLTLASIWFIFRFRLPVKEVAEAGQQVASRPFSSLRDVLARNRPFVLFEAGVFLGYIALYAAAPLYRIYWVRDLGATGSWMGALTAAASLGMGLGNLAWGRWSSPARDRWLYLLASLGAMGLYPIATALCGTLPALLWVVALAGFFVGCDLILFNRTVQVTPHGRRPTFLAVHNLTANLAGFVAPLISSAAANHMETRSVLIIVGGLGLLGAVLLYAIGWAERPAHCAAGPQ
jgi:hypothetical protein